MIGLRKSFAAILALAALNLPAQLAAAPDPDVERTLASLPRYEPGPKVEGTISLWGHGSPTHDFVGDLVKRWFDEFHRSQPGVKLDYRMYGTASAIGALASGAGTLAILGEEISPDASRMFRRARGYAPLKVEIANGSVDTNYFDYAHMIFVHKDNPLTRLTVGQLEAIFGAEHRCFPGTRPVRRWADLGLKGPLASRQIVPYSWKTDVDFALFFRERILCGSHRWNPAVREFMPVTRPDGTVTQHGQLVLEALARDPAGIAISNVRFANPNVRPLLLSWETSRDYVAASNETLMSRRYPLVRIIPAFIDRRPGHPMRAAEREFLRFILSREGQSALVEHSGYLPLDRRTLMAQRAKLR